MRSVKVIFNDRKKIIISIFLIGLFFLFGSYAKAGLYSNIREFGHDAYEQVIPPTPAIVIANLIKWLLTILGVVFATLIVYSGYQWLTAGGNEEQIGEAKKRIINAVLGLVLCLTAYAITYMILEGVIETVQGRF